MSSITLEDRAAIGDRVHLFYALVDEGKASQTPALFTDDASWTFGPGSPKPGTLRGEGIREAMVAREAQTSAFTRHAVTNMRFAQHDDGAVELRYVLTVYRSDDESRHSTPAFVTDVDERWQRTDDAWRIAMRTILPAFARS